jgi:hypothetical protein
MLFLVLAAVAALMLPLSAQAGRPGELPFRYEDGLIWLKVDCAGNEEPLNFLLDSGASVSVIDLRVARTCGAQLDAKRSVQGVSGQSLAYVVKDLQVRVGSVALSYPILAMDLGAINERCHRRVDGILGVDFFHKSAVRIDFKASKIWLLNASDVETANCVVLPIEKRNGVFCVPVKIASDAAVQWMRLDTGCDSALEWVVAGTEKRRMNQPSIGLATPAIRYISTSAWIGKHCFNGITAGIHPNAIFPGEDGLVGNGLLSRFCVTIDERGGRVIFEQTR